MQGYAQYGGLRPFGVSLLYAGWDAQNKYQLYQSDPSGNYGGWKATAIGANQQVQNPLTQPLYLFDINDDLCSDLTSLLLSMLHFVSKGSVRVPLTAYFITEGLVSSTTC